MNTSTGFNFSDLFRWLGEHASRLGEHILFTALVLYYAALSPHTPAWARAVIIGALAYLISPVDAYPDVMPGGYTDDVGVMVKALAVTAIHITPEVKERARIQVAEWFGRQ
jgi:uncharacterized membrane protein YkvA (DUF1232 family)